jgi:drug/metabolite transporter (DMT)-like permease
VLTILVGLSSALSYATSDLLSQRVTRAARALTQVAWVLITGALIIVPIALLVDGLPSGGAQWRAAGAAALAGVAYFGAFLCLLRGLRRGDLGLISALNALQGAYAMAVFVLLGQHITPLLGLALALCVVGAVLASFEGGAKTAKGVPWAIASGLLFGCVAVFYSLAHDISWLSQAAISRSVSLVIAAPAALLTGGIALPRRQRETAVGAGVLELCGLVFFTMALAMGPLTVAAVTATQFGTFAVILGVAFLHERPRRHQWVGIGCTLVGVTVLAVTV